MSAKALAACSFEPHAEQVLTTNHRAPASIAAEILFREDLWDEHRREAINAGFNTAQAIVYASALSLEMGPVGGVPGIAPVGRNWFYQSRAGVVRRTITSGLITLTRREERKSPRRNEASGASALARAFRWWNGGEKS